MKKFSSVLFFFLLSIIAHAQDFSNKGKDFWLAYPAHVDGNNSRMALYISSDVSTSGTVFLNGSSIPFNVTANQATVVQVFPGTYPVLHSGDNTTLINRGIHVTSLAPVVVYAHILNAARSGSTLVLPTNTLGREYIATSFKSTANASPGGPNGSASGSQVTIVGVENNTVVEITPSATNASMARPANIPFTVTLNQGDVYQLRSTFSNDFTGTIIRSLASGNTTCKPIAVFSGSSWTSMDCSGGNSGDNLFVQLMPKSAWGKNYVTAPFADRRGDIYRVIVSDPTTVVTRSGTVLPLSSLVNNTYYQFSSDNPEVISSDKPVQLVQYMVSQNCDFRNTPGCGSNACAWPGDPEMIILNPIEQTINDVTVVSARNNLTPPNTNISKHFFTIIMKSNAAATLRIDGNVPTGVFQPIGSSGYSYLHENVTASTNINPSHRIKADSGFIALAYGHGAVESYGYNAGTNVRDLYQFVSIRNLYAEVNYPATCTGSPFFFSMTFPYQPAQIKWQFSGMFADVTINAPVADSTWNVNGKQLYLYKLPGSYTANAVGTFPIKVLAQNTTPDGCSGEQEINYELQVIQAPTADFSFTSNGCVSDSVRFTDLSNGFGRPMIAWQWDFDDNGTASTKTPAHKFAAAGSYDVKLKGITDIGCITNEVSKTINLSEPPVALFGISAPTCIGRTINFTDSSTTPGSSIVKWYWDFGDGGAPVVATTNAMQSHTYLTTGQKTVTLKVETAGGCYSTVFGKTIQVGANPVAAFTFGTACLPPGAMPFTNTSTINDGTGANLGYQWNFGDNNTSTEKDPVHTYATAGPFTVKLTVTSNAGCTHETSSSVNTVYALPLAVFTMPAQVCAGTSFSITDGSTSVNNTVTEWEYVFDDGTRSTLKNPGHTFQTPGVHTVTLVVKNAAGCSSTTATQSILVNPVPTASFGITSTKCATKDISFENLSAVSSGSIVKWTWNLDDGNGTQVKSTGTAFNTTYPVHGPRNISLQTESDKGCVSRLLDTVVMIHPQPVPGFAMSENCLVDPFSEFTDTSSIADGSEAAFTYLWNFGDPAATPGNPNTSTAKVPQHKYSQATTYTVSLTVTSGNGCIANVQQPFTINGSVPVAAFEAAPGNTFCSNDSVAINNYSTADVGGIIRLEIFWDAVNDPLNKTVDQFPAVGKVYKTKYPEFFTPATKNYTVRIVAYSGDNCMKDSSITIQVKATPEVVFNPLTNLCANDAAVTLTQASSVNPVGGVGVYSGNGVNGNSFNPSVAATGVHTIRYTHTANNGCINFKEQTIEVYPVPTVNAGPDRIILEGGIDSLFANATGNALQYLWTPSVGISNATVLRPKITPKDDITYTLTVLSADGCKNSDAVLVKVLKAPTVPNVFTPNGDGINDTWEIKHLESYRDATIEIFNRYGQPVYYSRGYTKPWDGRFNGNALPAGTYYYIVNPGNGRRQLTGYVDIVR